MFIRVMSRVYYKRRSLTSYVLSKHYWTVVTLHIVFILAIIMEHIVNTWKHGPISRGIDNEP